MRPSPGLGALLLALGACAAPPGSPGYRGAFDAAQGYQAGQGYQSCVPFARERSGIRLGGDAWQWWDAAAGRYARGGPPRPGSVLVFARTARLRDGHLSVVTEVISDREVRVDHANWASGGLKGRVALDQAVIDVSPGNDWSAVRVWYPPIGAVGNTVFPALGFVHHDILQAAVGPDQS
ncbi:CHAP domain-containing protein [Roseomonas sp. BN140053]|uniref:CHAP domain-containing protein n=1 Tax=Roseomonas sp. BN140053 TaxID=3391898 RepID=UPI0039E80DD9